MKLTREQVSQLSDVELNLAMIWLYWDKKIQKNYTYMCSLYKFGLLKTKIEYLTDYNLTMPLVIKHKILHSIHYCASGLDDKPIYKAYGQFKCRTESEYCPALLRAYCECLVLIAMEREE